MTQNLLGAFFFPSLAFVSRGVLASRRQNVGWASTCNSVGQTAGYFLGNVVFMALESPEFCNAYLRSEPHPEGIVTLASQYPQATSGA